MGNANGQRALRVLLADEDPGALRVIAGQVRELGHEPTEIAVDLRQAAEAIARDDADFVAEAAESGIFAYARQETTESIQSAIEVAMRRWRDQHELGEKIERLEGALERRALIERAKGILMERHDLDDRAAFELLREHARSNNRTVVGVASAVTEGHALLRKARD